MGTAEPGAVRATAAVALTAALAAGAGVWREGSQRADVAAAVEPALERAALLQEQERYEEALVILTVAEGQLEGHGMPSLRQRVAQRRRDLDMLIRLNEARLQESAPGMETGFDRAARTGSMRQPSNGTGSISPLRTPKRPLGACGSQRSVRN